MFDIRNKTFDWFNNPYVHPNVYHLDQNYKAKIHPTIKLKKCTKDDYLKYMNEIAADWYRNSLCFEDKSKI